jgi:hypothetical protein
LVKHGCGPIPSQSPIPHSRFCRGEGHPPNRHSRSSPPIPTDLPLLIPQTLGQSPPARRQIPPLSLPQLRGVQPAARRLLVIGSERARTRARKGMRGASWRRRRREHEGAAPAGAQRDGGAGLVAHMAFSDLWRVSLAHKVSFRLLPRMSLGPSTSRSWESTSRHVLLCFPLYISLLLPLLRYNVFDFGDDSHRSPNFFVRGSLW